MSEEVVTHFRRIKTLGQEGYSFDDPDAYLALSDWQMNLYRNNPFKISHDDVVQIFGTIGNRVIGGVGPLGIQVWCYGNILNGCASTYTFVNKQFRKTEYGLYLNDAPIIMTKDGVSVNSGLSQKAQKVCRLTKTPMFSYRRYCYIWHSRGFLKYHLPKAVLPLASFFADALLWVQRCLVYLLARLFTWRWKILEIESQDDQQLEDVARIVASDSHPFREHHPAAWFKWVLTNDFHDDPKTCKKLYGVYSRGQMIGFFLVNSRKKWDSTRVIEWGLLPEYVGKTKWLLLRAVRYRVSKTAWAEIPEILDDPNSVSLFKKLMLHRLEDQVVVVGAMPNSPIRLWPDWNKCDQWRVRSGMGDAAFW